MMASVIAVPVVTRLGRHHHPVESENRRTEKVGRELAVGVQLLLFLGSHVSPAFVLTEMMVWSVRRGSSCCSCTANNAATKHNHPSQNLMPAMHGLLT